MTAQKLSKLTRKDLFNILHAHMATLFTNMYNSQRETGNALLKASIHDLGLQSSVDRIATAIGTKQCFSLSGVEKDSPVGEYVYKSGHLKAFLELYTEADKDAKIIEQLILEVNDVTVEEVQAVINQFSAKYNDLIAEMKAAVGI